MRRFVAKALIVFGLVLIGNGSAHSQSANHGVSDYENGKVDAHRAIKKNKLVIKGWVLGDSRFNTWPSRSDVYASLLRRKYNIRFENFGGCMIPAAEEAYIHGYNEVSIAAIKRKYGPRVLELARNESDRIYDVRYAEKDRAWAEKFKTSLLALPPNDHR